MPVVSNTSPLLNLAIIGHKASWLLLDEREARRIAKLLELEVTGLLGVLIRAKYEGRLMSLRAVMERLQHEAGFRIGADLFAEILQKVGEY